MFKCSAILSIYVDVSKSILSMHFLRNSPYRQVAKMWELGENLSAFGYPYIFVNRHAVGILGDVSMVSWLIQIYLAICRLKWTTRAGLFNSKNFNEEDVEDHLTVKIVASGMLERDNNTIRSPPPLISVLKHFTDVSKACAAIFLNMELVQCTSFLNQKLLKSLNLHHCVHFSIQCQGSWIFLLGKLAERLEHLCGRTSVHIISWFSLCVPKLMNLYIFNNYQ